MSDFSKDDYLADMDDVESLGAKDSENEIDKPSSGSLASSIYSSIMKESKVKSASEAKKKNSEKSNSKKRKKKFGGDDSQLTDDAKTAQKEENEDGSLTPLGKAKAEAEAAALDDIDRAREHEDADSSLVAVGSKIDKVFAKFEVEKFGAKGDEFDPSRYEAVLQKTDENVEKPVVDTVVEAGYCMGERVIRAARVVVAVPAED